MAAELRRRGVEATFALVGPDDGELRAVQRLIADKGLQTFVCYEGPLDYGAVQRRMTQADLYVLPSVDEPFPMSLLEALSLGLPSVCTDSCGLADVLQEHGAAVVTDGTVNGLASAVQAILTSPPLRSELSSNALKMIAERFSMQAIGDQLERSYREIVGSTGLPLQHRSRDGNSGASAPGNLSGGNVGVSKRAISLRPVLARIKLAAKA
jgi:glycosyltransferase involved in cell wall biosynthesis